jgi:predicted enzyme related to lactoylglutathione lyase
MVRVMRLVFHYAPSPAALGPTVAFYRDALGWDEAWREGTETVAFPDPGRAAQIMVSLTDQPPGPMFLVDDLAAYLAAHPDLPVVIPPYAIPNGSVAGVADPAGNTLYLFDQPGAA